LRGFKGQRNDLWKELDGVELVNHAGAISAALKHYREVAMVYTALVYLIVIALLVFRYGPSHALRTLIPPTLGAATSLAILALCGVPINVFSVFALLVLVGLSIDYAIFCAEDDDTGPCTNFAVLLSAITTAISFGLLSFSSTPALRSFGIVLSIGVMVAALIAPLAGTSSPTSATRTRKVSALVCMLILLSGCSLRLPKPRVTTSIVSDQGLFRYVCPNTPRRGERSIPGEEQRLAVLECRESSAVVVLLNRHGLRIQTVTLTEEGTVQSETSYLAEDPIEPEALLSEFSTLSPASTHF
jgi:hypothetical protein